jgi:hypothetical protein
MKMSRLFNEPRPIKELIAEVLASLQPDEEKLISHNEFFEPKFNHQSRKLFKYKTMKLFFRILSSPFVLIIIILAALRYMIISFYGYVRYGGELMFYSKKINPKTVAETITKLINNGKEKMD